MSLERSPPRLRVLPTPVAPPTAAGAPPVAAVAGFAPVPFSGPTWLSPVLAEQDAARAAMDASETRTLNRRNIVVLIRLIMEKPRRRAHALPEAPLVCTFPTKETQVSLTGKSEAQPLWSSPELVGR